MRFIAPVKKGDGIGSQLGFPTANLSLSGDDAGLLPGVYAARAEVLGQHYIGALAVQQQPDKVEIHLLDYGGGALYGEDITVLVVEQVSDMQEFFDTEGLIQKIADDVEKCRLVVGSKGAQSAN